MGEAVAHESLEQRCQLAERLQREAEIREKATKRQLEETTVRRTMEVTSLPPVPLLLLAIRTATAQPSSSPPPNTRLAHACIHRNSDG